MAEAPKVFISYSHDSPEHSDRVLALSNRLRQGGVDCCIDQYELSPPEGWPQWCEKQVEQSWFVLVACTETYLRRFKCEENPGKGLGVTWEGHIVTQALYDAQGENSKFIPIGFSPQDAGFVPLTLRSATRYDAGSAEGYERLYRHLTGQPAVLKPDLGELVEMPPLATPETLPPLPRLERKQTFFQPWNVPIPRNPFFTGRERTLKDIDAAFKEERAVALCGLPGVGKTQTATHYAYLHRSDYKAVLWVGAASREALASGFAALADLLTLPGSKAQDQTQAVKAAKRWLEASSDWLLILDNANELPVLHEFGLPLGKGRLLFTTQAQALGGLARPVEILEMEPEEGALFLLQRATLLGENNPLDTAAESDQRLALQISQELGGLPLALDQAGAYVEETGCGLARYLELYRKQGAELRKRRGGTSPDHASVAVTFALSIENVRQASEPGAEILRLCAFLDPDAILEEILTDGAPYLGPVLAAAAVDPLRLDAALGVALRYSLLRRSDGTLRVHRLVQHVIQDGMTDEEKRGWAERAVRAVNQAFPSPNFANWRQCERMLPHGLACAGLVSAFGLETGEAAHLLHEAALYLDDRARYAEAEQLYRRSLPVYEKIFGLDHPNVATNLSSLAGTCLHQGKYAQAEPLYERSQAIRERALGPDDPGVATGLNNQALLYMKQGKYAEAERLHERSLAIREKALGPDHPDVGQSLSNLAELNRTQGKYLQAEQLSQRSVAISEKALGPDDPDVAKGLNNLALLYSNQGKLAKAQPLFERALAIWERALGPDHPDVATGLSNLANVYFSQGKLAKAQPLIERALAISERALGPDHPDVAKGLNGLALLYRSQGKLSKAKPLFERALAISERALGPDHPDVATGLSNLAEVYFIQGNRAKAQPLIDRALVIWETAFGPDHPDVAKGFNSVAALYCSQGEFAKAQPLFQRSLAILKKALGPDHPEVAAVLENYARLLRRTRRKGQAREMEARAKAIRAKDKFQNPS